MSLLTSLLQNFLYIRTVIQSSGISCMSHISLDSFLTLSMKSSLKFFRISAIISLLPDVLLFFETGIASIISLLSGGSDSGFRVGGWNVSFKEVRKECQRKEIR